MLRESVCVRCPQGQIHRDTKELSGGEGGKGRVTKGTRFLFMVRKTFQDSTMVIMNMPNILGDVLKTTPLHAFQG